MLVRVSLPVFTPLRASNLSAILLRLLSRSLHEQNFHPMIVLQLNVKRADHLIEKTALEFGESLQQISFRFVVHDGDCSSHERVSLFFPMFQGGVGDHDGDRFRAAFPTSLRDELIQFAKDGLRKRDADSLHFAVGISVITFGSRFHLKWIQKQTPKVPRFIFDFGCSIG